MPDYYLFHQNMNVFDGCKSEQNQGFNKAMLTISGRLKDSRVVAAGFTEVIGFHTNTVTSALSSMAGNLDTQLTPPALFATGVPDSRYGTFEYTAISLSIRFKVEARGRVMLVNQKDGKPQWTCVSDEDMSISEVYPFVTSSDTIFAPDSRGLAYVCGEYGDQKMTVGFMHAISGSGRENTYQTLIGIMSLIWEKHPDYNEYPTIFGGDFVFKPSPIGGPYYAIYACVPSGHSTAVSTDSTDNTASTAAPSDCAPLATTAYGCYDFWVANEQITNDYASVYGETMDKDEGLSDHCGIALRLPMEVKFGD